MGETFEPLDSVDVQAVVEGAIDPDDARPVEVPDTDPGLDSERPVLLEDRRDSETTPDAESVDGLDIEQTLDPSDQ